MSGLQRVGHELQCKAEGQETLTVRPGHHGTLDPILTNMAITLVWVSGFMALEPWLSGVEGLCRL